VSKFVRGLTLIGHVDESISTGKVSQTNHEFFRCDVVLVELLDVVHEFLGDMVC